MSPLLILMLMLCSGSLEFNRGISLQTLGLIKQFAAEYAHEDVLDTRLATILLPRWATNTVSQINTFTKWRWNETFGEFTWPASGILYLPDHVDFPWSIYPAVDVSYTGTIEVLRATQFDRGRPDFTQDGVIRLVVYGYYEVELDNPGASQILITGDVADVGMVLLIEGLVNGRSARELVTVGGAGTVTSVQTYDAGVEGVRRITIVTPATAVALPVWGAGDIVATSGGVEICRINSLFRNGISCRRTELYGASGAIPTRYSRRHRPLYADTDIVEVPEEFEEIVELGILMRLEIFKENAEKAQAIKGLMDSRLKELMAWDKRQPAMTRVPSIKER